MHQTRIGDLLFFQSHLLKKYNNLIQAVSTRISGVSLKPFDSLNLSFANGDKLVKVKENRRRLCKSLGIKLENLTLGKQVHGCNVKVISQKDKGKGGAPQKKAIVSTDGMLTDKPGIALMALSADCPLILCYDPIKKVIGLIHASWRGVVTGICAQAIKLMRQQFSSQPKNIRVVISPSIGPCCYEVKKDFISVVTRTAPYSRHCFIRRRGKTYFDLWSFNRAQLRRSGVLASHIESANICTSCHPEWFYSWRRDGSKTGRFGAVISLTGKGK